MHLPPIAANMESTLQSSSSLSGLRAIPSVYDRGNDADSSCLLLLLLLRCFHVEKNDPDLNPAFLGRPYK